jgi:hypothetical protein
MYHSYAYYRRPGDMAVSFLAALVASAAVAAIVLALAWAAGAFSPSCPGPACVTARARTWICGPAGCGSYYWLYFSDNVFTQVSYRQWSAASVGSAWGSEAGQLRGAGVRSFFQMTSEDEANADGAGGLWRGASAASAEDETESYLDDEQTAINDETEDVGTPSEESQETYSPVRGSASPSEDEPADTDDSSVGGGDG